MSVIAFRQPCAEFGLAGDGTGLCSSCHLPRSLHHEACPKCHRKGMRGTRHKEAPFTEGWCNGQASPLRDRAACTLLGAREDLSRKLSTGTATRQEIDCYHHATRLCVAGRHAEALGVLAGRLPHPTYPTVLRTEIHEGKLVTFTRQA